MNALPLMLALALVATGAGCIGPLGAKDTPPDTPPEGEAVEPATAGEPAATPPASANASASPSSTSPASASSSSSAAASTPPPGTPVTAPMPPAPPRIDVASWNGSITAVSPGAQTGAVNVCCQGATVEEENAAGTIDVPVGAKGLVLELVWTDPQFDLDLELAASDAQDLVPPEPDGTTVRTRSGHGWTADAGNPGTPDHHAVIVVTDAEALALGGAWTWTVHTKTANAVAFQVYASIFHDEAPAAEYTAVPSGNP